MTEKYYRRYTELPALIHMLTHRELTLLDPQLWDDKNDSYFLHKYREKKELKSVLALCFTMADETYHHWKVFAQGSAGVCVKFKGSSLEASIRKLSGLKFKNVEYLKLKDLKNKSLPTAKLPFLKRYAFHPEKEIRLLWESKTEDRDSMPLPFDLSGITRITLSPWLHPALTDQVRSLLKSIDGCKALKISGIMRQGRLLSTCNLLQLKNLILNT
jgi:hypothetical protein